MSADPAGFALINPMDEDGEPVPDGWPEGFGPGPSVGMRPGYSVIEAINWYPYVSGNPVRYVDPTGEQRFTASEKDLFWDSLRVARIGRRNARRAREATAYMRDQHNSQGDAVRHALWSAMNTRDLGEKDAKKIADAHESASNQPAQEKRTDDWNNYKGILTARDNPGASDEELADEVKEAFNTGSLLGLEDSDKGGNRKISHSPPPKPSGQFVE